jgi:hypothetical protein
MEHGPVGGGIQDVLGRAGKRNTGATLSLLHDSGLTAGSKIVPAIAVTSSIEVQIRVIESQRRSLTGDQDLEFSAVDLRGASVVGLTTARLFVNVELQLHNLKSLGTAPRWCAAWLNHKTSGRARR